MKHHYALTLTWTGNNGSGTSGYREYERSHTVSIGNKPDLLGSSDPAFHGDKTRHNPEELLVAALASCHMLWYLHLCADAGIIVTQYTDDATGIMTEAPGETGRFTEVTLNPVVHVTDASMVDKAMDLHKTASAKCFISNSVNFPILHDPVCLVG
jgi:organic hydroperoxide reductase OsmC/OhrA